MRMNKSILMTMLLVSLVGCASTENYEKILESWIGANADRLIQAWGPPESAYELSDGSKVLQWNSRRTITTGGYASYQPVTTYTSGSYSGAGSYSGTSTTYVPTTTPVQTYDMQCVTRFTVSRDNIVKSWRWQGNDCTA